ncbi:MAG: response regulator [Oscillospiraceae bacterium]|nr:response regulator [Oscillospiraceae bacterium]
MPDIILLDIVMPNIDGYGVISLLKKSKATADFPVIFLTAMTNTKDEIKGLSYGAVDYIFKPFSADLLLQRVGLHLQLRRYSIGLEEMVAKKTRDIYRLQDSILETVSELVEHRDDITGGHISRTQNYLRLLVNRLIQSGIYAEELSSWDVDAFVMSSKLHDIGKISISDSILMKPGKLTDEEFEIVKGHAAFGRKIIERMESNNEENPFLEHAKLLAGSHHEKWDGTGYPYGLKGEQIPLQGRLMAVIDVYDALTNDRPYMKACTHGEAVNIIKEGFGTHFDPLICGVFLEHQGEFEVLESLRRNEL